jgi:hypothetical protein
LDTCASYFLGSRLRPWHIAGRKIIGLSVTSSAAARLRCGRLTQIADLMETAVHPLAWRWLDITCAP